VSADGTTRSTTADLKSLVAHLRLQFQLLLAPVFLWGWLVAGGGLDHSVVLGFVAFHAFLYSGVTAFNSYYDRDVGPVGGLAHPPSVTPALLPFSLAVQVVGWLLATLVNLPFFVLYGIFVLLSVAYSHPRIRLKAHTLTSLLVVGIGQGALAFLAAWAAVRGELAPAWSVDGALGAVTAVLLILALYPLTQLYQIDEDAARGDRTIAVAWGPRTCFALALAFTSLGGLSMIVYLARRFGTADALLVGAGLVAQVTLIVGLATRFDPREILRSYRQVMRLNVFSAGALGAYLLFRLALSSR
jgi:4-hydroxybenzoate polyprenyltransferase